MPQTLNPSPCEKGKSKKVRKQQHSSCLESKLLTGFIIYFVPVHTFISLFFPLSRTWFQSGTKIIMGKRRREEKKLVQDDNKKKRKDEGKKQSTENASGDVKKAETGDAAVNEVDLARLETVSGTQAKKEEQRLIVVLEDAHIETVKFGKGFGILNVDEHAGILRKSGRDFSTARPDITHQCLLMLLDSPLNRAGLLQVYIRTASNVLIEINPQTRIPRTFPRFAGLMVQLLHKFSVKAADTGLKLMKVIKNPVSDHLPAGCRKVLMSYGADKVVKAREIIPADLDAPLCVVIGAIAKGAIKTDYTEDDYCIGNYPLSAALTCAKITSAFEEAWGVF